MNENSQGGDSLGKLAARCESKAKATQNLVAWGGLVSVGVLTILLRNPIASATTGDARLFVAIGVLAAIIGLVMLVLNALSRRMSFEVRDGGVRFQSRREEVEIPWPEVRRVRVWETKILKQNRHVDTNWRISIVGVHDTIELSGWFLGLVENVPGLITMIEVKSGIKFERTMQEEDESRPVQDEPMTAEELIRRAEGSSSQSTRRKRRE